jgi:CheY-like chemotaxis protein
MQSDIDKKFGDLPESTKNPDPIAFELPNSASTYVVAAICALDGLLKFVYLQYWAGDHALERWERQFLKHCLQAIEDTCARRRGIQAESVKLTFLQHISHELRTPLHGMAGVMSQFQGTLDSLRTVVGDNGDCNASINELAKLCTDASGLQEDLRNLVDNLIDLSAGVDKDVGEEYHMGRLTIGEEKTTFSDENVLVSIEKVCRQALQACDGSTTHDQVPWIFLSSTEAAKSMHTLAAAPKVRGILTQFLSNAIRATQGVKDNKVPLIHIGVDRAGSTGEVVSIAISDNGVGMRPDILRSFKEPFVKADPHCLGMGIGATIGYAALESIGGGLKAESVIDKGTTITLTFPAQVSTKAGPSQPLPSALLRSARCTLSGSDIDQEVARHVRSLFTDLNVELQQSPSFPLSTHEIDFVLMSDSTFLDPSRSGASPFARIKNNEVVPIVVLCRRPDSAAEIHAAYPSLPDAVHWLHCLCNPIIGPELHGLADFLQNIMTATCTSPVREQVSPMPSISLSMDSIHSKGFLTEPTSVPSRSTTPSNAFSVLVVEDNPLNLRLLAQTMRKAGCTIFSATNGREAVDEFVRKRPSVILLDISMPIMDGFKACQLIREKEVEFVDEGMPPCRIIALTALSHPADKARGMEVGMDDWRTKPVNLRQIKADVERWKQAWPDEMLNVEQSVN